MFAANTEIFGCLLLSTVTHTDFRGTFREVFSLENLNDFGVQFQFIQENESFSQQAGTLRGLHLQKHPNAQSKLVRVTQGAIMDVVVDVRQDSPSYLSKVLVPLSAQEGNQIFIPEGCLHGFITREANTRVSYKISAGYHPADEVVIRFDDPEFGIDWGIDFNQLILSDKDASALSYAEWLTEFGPVK